eukprot:469738-Hanusia_phi.AAC.1
MSAGNSFTISGLQDDYDDVIDDIPEFVTPLPEKAEELTQHFPTPSVHSDALSTNVASMSLKSPATPSSKYGGGGDKCPRCKTTVYFAEAREGPDSMKYHKYSSSSSARSAAHNAPQVVLRMCDLQEAAGQHLLGATGRALLQARSSGPRGSVWEVPCPPPLPPAPPRHPSRRQVSASDSALACDRSEQGEPGHPAATTHHPRAIRCEQQEACSRDAAAAGEQVRRRRQVSSLQQDGLPGGSA